MVREAQLHPEAESSGYTVLVVEDDPTHQLLTRKALDEDGTPFSVVHFAETADEAEHLARQMEFDVLLVDNRIPGRRGLDLIPWLREAGVRTPCVLMTSVGNEDLAVQAHRLDVADYVIKDAGCWSELPQVLDRVVRTERERRQQEAMRERLERANERLDELYTEAQLQNQELRRENEELRRRLEALSPDEASDASSTPSDKPSSRGASSTSPDEPSPRGGNGASRSDETGEAMPREALERELTTLRDHLDELRRSYANRLPNEGRRLLKESRGAADVLTRHLQLRQQNPDGHHPH